MKLFFINIAMVSLIILFSNRSHAEEDHPIDIQLKKCMESEKNNAADNRDCIYKAEIEWDKELNKNYKILLSLIKNQNTKTALKEAQRKWVSFRDAEKKFITSFYNGFVGSMWLDSIAADVLEITKNRTHELASYMNTYEFGGEIK